MSDLKPDRLGVLYTAAAYAVWGVIPVFWKQIASTSADEIVAHRIVWTLAFTICLLWFRGRLAAMWSALKDRKALVPLALSALLIALNWGLFIWSVMAGRIIETSLGYYINPLVSVVLGVTLLGERLTRVQSIAIGLAAAGVTNQTVALGYLPWISLVLAVSFGVYGLIRKTVHVESIEGLTIETIVLAPLSIGYLAMLGYQERLSFGSLGLENDLLLILAGPFTAVPLLLFAAGARRIPLYLVGFLQYLSPSISLGIAVFVYGETFTHAHAVTFALIWSALALVSWDALRRAPYSAA